MLSRSHRFHGLGSLNFAYKQGQVVRSPLLGLKFISNPRRKTFRVAVVVSRKVNKSAVVRSRIRRRTFEAVQVRSSQITEPYDLVFTAFSEQITSIPFSELQQQIDKLLVKAGAIKAAGLPAHDIVSTEGN